MNNKREVYLVADPKIIKFHHKVQIFGVTVNEQIDKLYGDKYPNELASGALYSMTGNVFALHRAILSLCSTGWCFAAPILLRAMLDYIINITAIVNSKDDADYMAFKYLYSYHKNKLLDPSIIEDERRKLKATVDEGISKLNEAKRHRAVQYIDDPKPSFYWYNPEYRGPRDILNKYSNTEITYVYGLCSGAAHGGFVSSNIMKDVPDAVHPNPRADARSQNMSLIFSCRLMLEIFRMRSIFERAGAEKIYEQLLKELISLGPLMKWSDDLPPETEPADVGETNP